MPFVNHGRTNQERNANCAMCSLAAVINQICGATIGTDTVANMLHTPGGGQTDDHLAAAFGAGHLAGGAQLNVVVQHMQELVVQAANFQHHHVVATQGGSFGHFLDPAHAKAFMNAKDAGTAFAVWGCHADMDGLGAHWNFATTHEVASWCCWCAPTMHVRFFDYQDNSGNGIPPFASDAFIAPHGNRGESASYTKLIVLSFE